MCVERVSSAGYFYDFGNEEPPPKPVLLAPPSAVHDGDVAAAARNMPKDRPPPPYGDIVVSGHVYDLSTIRGIGALRDLFRAKGMDDAAATLVAERVATAPRSTRAALYEDALHVLARGASSAEIVAGVDRMARERGADARYVAFTAELCPVTPWNAAVVRGDVAVFQARAEDLSASPAARANAADMAATLASLLKQLPPS